MPAVRRDRQRYRALDPLGEADARLLAIVDRGEFAINGFRNRNVRAHLYPATEARQRQEQRMAVVGRRLRVAGTRFDSRSAQDSSLRGNGKRTACDHARCSLRAKPAQKDSRLWQPEILRRWRRLLRMVVRRTRRIGKLLHFNF